MHPFDNTGPQHQLIVLSAQEYHQQECESSITPEKLPIKALC
jgi:hypothetical protein